MRGKRRQKQGEGHKREIKQDFRRSHALGITVQYCICTLMDAHTFTRSQTEIAGVLGGWLLGRPQHKHYAEEKEEADMT